MFPRFATAFFRTRTRGLSGPTFTALAAIAIVVAGMFASMVTTVRSLDSLSKDGRRSSDVVQSTLRVERLVVDLEVGVRGYLLTDDPRFLEAYDNARGGLSERITRL